MTKEKMLEFLNSDEQGIDFHMAPDPLIKLLEEIDPDAEIGDAETNGWQVDFWIEATVLGKEMSLSGSAWYGTARIDKGLNEKSS